MVRKRDRIVRIAVGFAFSVLYWIAALFSLLFSQIGDPAPELRTPEGMSLVYASRQRISLIILVAEVVIYAALVLLVRRASKPRSD